MKILSEGFTLIDINYEGNNCRGNESLFHFYEINYTSNNVVQLPNEIPFDLIVENIKDFNSFLTHIYN